MNEEQIKLNLEKIDFQCQKCSNCCRKEPGAVFLTKTDIENIIKNLNITFNEFYEKCTETVYKDDKKLLILKEKPNYDCIFWNNGC